MRSPNLSSRYSVLLIGTLLSSVACANPAEPVRQKSPATSYSVQGEGRSPRSHSAIADQFKRLSQIAPGFTGVYFDEQGDLTVSVATDTFSSGSMDRVISWARSYSVSASTKTSAKLRRVEFSYATLSDQYDRILVALKPDDGVNKTYIDETKGVIGLGLASLTKAPLLQARLASIGVPSRMVVFEESQLGIPETTLNQKRRPLIGGLQIQHFTLASTCSLGFNVWRRGEDGYSPDPSLGNYFFTASHCSGYWGVYSGSFLYQNVTGSGNRVGVEYEVAPKLVYPACPSPALSPCQIADVLVGRADDSVQVSYGTVANVDASKNIIGTFNVQGQTYGGLDGETITMVGATSGKKTSTILATCVNKTFQDAIAGGSMTILCLQETNYASGSGDSGAPVFIPYSPTNWNTPRIIGIHMGSALNAQGVTRRYFSPITQIEYALPTLYYWF